MSREAFEKVLKHLKYPEEEINFVQKAQLYDTRSVQRAWYIWQASAAHAREEAIEDVKSALSKLSFVAGMVEVMQTIRDLSNDNKKEG